MSVTVKYSLIHKLALFAVFAAFVVIALGAFTRLADAGLGCPDWPTCYGHVLWPGDAEQTAAANQIFNETPVEHDKTWPEQVHRLFASSLGLISLLIFGLALSCHRKESQNDKNSKQRGILIAVVLSFLIVLMVKIALTATWTYGATAMHDQYDIIVGLVVLALFAVIAGLGLKYGSSHSAIKHSAFLVGFVVLQGLFGMWTVTLKVWPQVVTLHLLGGFTVVSLFWLLALRLRGGWRLINSDLVNVKSLKNFAIAGLVIVFIQIALGGWTTSNYAALACPDLPTCQNQLWPKMNFSQGFNVFQEIGPSYLGGMMENSARVAIHMSHRIGAMMTTVYLIFLFFKLIRVKHAVTTRMAYIVLGVLLTQVALGLGNIVFHFPLGVAILHNGVGAILLLVMVTLNQRIITATDTSKEQG